MKNTIRIYDICELSEFKQEDIQISRFAPYLKGHANLNAPHKHNFYHLVLLTEGGGSHAIDFERFKVVPMQIYFMIPGQVHSWSFEGHVDGYIINFSVPFFQSFLLKPDYLEDFAFFNGIPSDSVVNIPSEMHPEIISLFEEIVRESENAGYYSIDLVKTLMLQIFIQITRVQPVPQNKNIAHYNYTLLKNFNKLVEQNYHTLKLPKDYAALLYITPNHLNALCKDLLGIPAGEVIRNRIMLEAKRLLVNLELSVTEIAYQLSFSDNSYFTKFFKKQAGVTPEEFRKRNY